MNLARRIAIATFAAALPVAAFAQAPAAPKDAAAGGKCVAKDDKLKVKMTTSMGPIVLELDKAKAPITVDNFAKYVESGHYNGTIFHRVINGFMIQGGGMTKTMAEKPTTMPIKNEAQNGLKNSAYTVAMARTQNPHSATAQFFINVVDNAMLDPDMPTKPGYAVFGKVIEGKETVDKIKLVPTGNSGMHQNVPTTPIVIEKAECI
jgi:cyclophilin family peptidyl-prolyl cis-trans isomerase